MTGSQTSGVASGMASFGDTRAKSEPINKAMESARQQYYAANGKLYKHAENVALAKLCAAGLLSITFAMAAVQAGPVIGGTMFAVAGGVVATRLRLLRRRYEREQRIAHARLVLTGQRMGEEKGLTEEDPADSLKIAIANAVERLQAGETKRVQEKIALMDELGAAHDWGRVIKLDVS